MIRELEGPRRPHVVIIADLRGPDPEGVASRAAGMADDALRQGARVQLATAEVDGPRFGDVPTSLHVGRRLARAVVGAPALAQSRPARRCTTSAEVATGERSETRTRAADTPSEVGPERPGPQGQEREQ